MRRPGAIHFVTHEDPGAQAAALDVVRSCTATRAVLGPADGTPTGLTVAALRARTSVLHCHGPALLMSALRVANRLRRPLAVSLATGSEMEAVRRDAGLSSACRAASLVVVADAGLARWVEELGVAPQRIRVVPMAVDLSAPPVDNPAPVQGRPLRVRALGAALEALLRSGAPRVEVVADAVDHPADVVVIGAGADPAGLVALNALAAGRLVLTTDAEVAERCGGAAVLAPEQDQAALLAILDGLAADPEAWARRTRAGREHVARHHELGARTADLERLWLALAAGQDALWVPAAPHAWPTARVVMVTHNRKALLDRALTALSEQTRPAEEVVVVDNGSTDGTAELLQRRLEEGAPQGLQVITREDNLPVAEGRNLAAAGAETDLLVFTDDDCRPRPTWLECLSAGMSDGIDLVQGRTVPDPEQPLERLSRSQSTPAEFGLYETCNIAYRREAFERVKGFDLGLAQEVARVLGPRWERYPFGEDTDLGWRVKESGSRSAFAVHAVVDHEVFAPDPSLLVRRAALAAGFPLMVRRIPALRRVFLTAGLVLGRHRVRLWVAVVGVATSVALVNPFPLLLVLPYADDVLALRRWHRRSGRRALLREAAVLVRRDAVETVALLRGAVRARSLVL